MTLSNTPTRLWLRFSRAAGCGIGAMIVATYAFAAPPNPDYVFVSQGEAVAHWHWVVADPANWWLPLNGREGQSQGGKVKIAPTDYQAKGDAVRIEWAKKDTYGSVALAGHTTNLAPFTDKAELVLVARIEHKPKSDVTLSLECGENCSAAVVLNPILKQAPFNEWFVLPVALDCFAAAGAKLEQVATPFKIATTSRFKLSISAAYIQPLAKGDQGCTPDAAQAPL